MKLPGNMQAMMKQAQQMQQRMQEEVEKIVEEGSAGGVTIKMDGHKKVLSVKIDPDAAGDAEMLQDMVMVAFNEAHKKVEAQSQKIMGGMLGGMGLPPGMF